MVEELEDELSPQEIDSAPSRRKKAKEEMRRRMEKQDLCDILALPAGRRFYMRMMEQTKVFSQTFTGESLSGAYNEGLRSVGLFLRNEFIEADYDNVLLAEVEHRRQEEQDNARRD